MSFSFSRLIILLLLFLSTLTACQTAANITDLKQLSSAALQQDTSLVFGRVQWLEGGVEKEIGSGIITFSMTPKLVRLEDETRIAVEMDETGRFTWALPKGTYVINRIDYRDPWTGNYFMVPKVAFKVAENGKAYALGTLRIDHDAKRNMLGGMGGSRARFSLVDTAESDMAAFKTRLQGANLDMKKSLFVRDNRLPGTFDTKTEFNLAMQILQTLLYGIR